MTLRGRLKDALCHALSADFRTGPDATRQLRIED
jgi:hypothetical protein